MASARVLTELRWEFCFFFTNEDLCSFVQNSDLLLVAVCACWCVFKRWNEQIKISWLDYHVCLCEGGWGGERKLIDQNLEILD